MKRIGTVLFGVLALAALASAPASAQFNLDHYKCYKAKDLKNPKFVKTTVSLADQFSDDIPGYNSGNPTTAEVKKPFLFCTPVNKNNEGIINDVDHLTCYKIKDNPKLDKADRPDVQVVNQLGTLKLNAKKAFLLCVPSEKTCLANCTP
jgi:hypothetical protein